MLSSTIFHFSQSTLNSLYRIVTHCWSIVSLEDAARAQILELLFIRSGVFCLDSFAVSNVKLLIDGLCTC